MKRNEGITIARRFQETLRSQGYPVQRTILFGSVARDQATEDSDLDIAIVWEPFAKTRHEENMVLRRVRWEIDLRIEPISLHPDDFEKPSMALPSEVQREGVDV